ncbi:uncharacterized protein [Coffea arabica]|uniref:Uncharacterized protein isoform X2 n=1 Tax=Coffea arabica TaxID=13443 RepID=A0A6P6SAY9_COFAR|nr:transcription elongation factor B polypeptide 3-like isoform X2 [Coffea arabica]XP_027127309.1 transcription elongation factor B polypeptide 3 isoform X2 [Coffea arabica]
MQGIPSLVDLCVQIAVLNVRYLGNVGETEFHLLERILPHCTMDQLIHVENCTEGRDLSPVTNKLWKKFFERQFGAESAELVVERMKKRRVEFKWRELYKAKSQELEEKEKKISERLKQRYANEAAEKQKRRVQICTKVPPSSCKRSFFGAGPYNGMSNGKSSIMKKAKLEFLNSREVKNLAAVKNKAVQTSYSVSSSRKPSGFSSVASSSTFKPKPVQRRF